MKVNELIKVLKIFDKNSEVFLSSDSEGNSFGTIEPDSIYREFANGKHVCIIYPAKEGLDYTDLSNEIKEDVI